jgi:hypothetical protein
LVLGAASGFAATKLTYNKTKTVPKTTSGKPVTPFKTFKMGNSSMSQFKAQNHLSYAMNQKILTKAKAAPKGSYVNGTIDTVPYFSSWFITGGKNSVYPYAMVGQNPKAGGNTNIYTQVIPLVTVLLYNGSPVAVYDPTAPNDGDSDINLFVQSPLYDASTTYPGPPADTGQFNDTMQRNEFKTYGGWHTTLVPTSSGIIWVQFLEYFNGDWTTACGSFCFPVFNINTISNNFANILSSEAPANSTVPVIITDYLTAFDPSGGCCIGGYHTAQQGIQDPTGILTWAWATYIPHSDQAQNPFIGFEDITALSHELSELINDPFVNTLVSPWVDGSVSFAQGNLETGDVIEGMSAADSLYQVTLNTTAGAYTYNPQNEATLPWFTRNPYNGGVYSWPNEHTLSQAPHKPGCTQPFVCSWLYGQGSGAFYFGPPF